MASAVDISNLALGRLGDDATVSSIEPPEGSMQAEHCARFYPIARDTILAMHDWGFASRRKALAPLSNVPHAPWRFAYAQPAACLKVIRVLDPTGRGEAAFVSESADNDTPVLLTDQEGAVLFYVARVVDAARFPPLFVDALVWLLASHIAGPLIKGETGASMAQQAYQAYLGALQRAIAGDMAQYRPERPEPQTPWIEDC